jgi:hypothetical protein
VVQPGDHDSNAARSAIASKYIEQCSGLWVVAPITRAVDDKVAQNLLGDSFKRQLQLDGKVSSITFICSKADVISTTEALKALPEEEHAHQLEMRTRLLETERDKLQDKVDELKHRHAELKNASERCLAVITDLTLAMNGPDKEGDVFLVAIESSRKRPARESEFLPRKRLRGQLEGKDPEDSDST